MRDKARKILFEELEKSGWQWVVFNEENPSKNNGIIECLLDAMQKFRKIKGIPRVKRINNTDEKSFFKEWDKAIKNIKLQ